MYLQYSNETETLDRLYLEWSQFTKARTSRELAGMWSRSTPPSSLTTLLVGYMNHDGSIAYAVSARWRPDRGWVILFDDLGVSFKGPAWNVWMAMPSAQ